MSFFIVHLYCMFKYQKILWQVPEDKNLFHCWEEQYITDSSSISE